MKDESSSSSAARRHLPSAEIQPTQPTDRLSEGQLKRPRLQFSPCSSCSRSIDRASIAGGKSSFRSSRRIFAGPYPCWTGRRLRSSRTRSLPGRLADVMAPPKLPKDVMDYFVDECYKMVQDGKSPTNENTFFKTLGESMSQNLDSTFSRRDLIQVFGGLRRLWDSYHVLLKDLTVRKTLEKGGQTDPEYIKGLRLKSGSIYASRYTDILTYEKKLNIIFAEYYRHKAKSLSRYEFNAEHSDRYSGDNSVTSKRHSIDEPFSRQHRQKSSDINMPESSQNGGASDREDYERALGELLNPVNNVDNMTYSLACQCLQNPKVLYAYSRLPTMERKISFLQLTWRLKYDPNSILENLPPTNQLM